MIMKKIIALLLIIFGSISAQDFAEISFLNSSHGLLLFDDIISKKTTLYVTNDGGESWDSILEGKSMKSIYQFNTSRIYVGYESKGIAYTIDGGINWSFEDFGKDEALVQKISFANSNYGWVCTNKAVYITTNGGNSWTETGGDRGWMDALSINLLGVDKGWLLKVDGEVFKYNKNGDPYWTDLGNLGGSCYGPNAGIYFVDSLKGYAVGAKRSYKTLDGGKNWQLLESIVNKSMNGFHIFNESSFYLCGLSGIYYTDNGGQNFNTVFNDGINVLSIDFIDNQNGWAVNKEKIVLKTTDGGSTWSGGNVTSASAPVILSVDDKPNDNGGYVILTFERSNLDGVSKVERLLKYDIYSIEKNWLYFEKSVFPEQKAIYQIELKTENDSSSSGAHINYYQIKAVTFSNHYESNVVGGYSLDNLHPYPPEIIEGIFQNGEIHINWEKSSSEDVESYQIFRSTDSLFVIDTMTIYTQTIDTTFIDTSIPSYNINSLYYKIFAQDSSGYLSDEPSVLEVLLNVTNVEDRGQSQRFSLSQNYPNPFNPSTKITFTIPEKVATHNVTLKIFDILGREIQTLVNEKLSSGIHGVEFNADELPSGIYLYTLNVKDKFTSTKKMLLIK